MKESEKLYYRIQYLDNLYENNKTKRTLICVLIYTALSYAYLYWDEHPEELIDFIINIPVALIMGAILLYINMLIIGTVASMGYEETSHLESLKREYKDLVSKGR